MSDSESNVSKLNGSSGFISYEESKSEGWSSENSVDYTLQNKRNNRRLLKRRNQSAYNRIYENVLREENRDALLSRDKADGGEHDSPEVVSPNHNSKATLIVSSTPQNANLPATGSYSEEAVNIFNYYKQFGDFWNVFPKTDYVYSRHSKWYGSEVAPGIPRIPNMCRPTYRGRYRETLATRIHQAADSNEYEETLFIRVRRIIRTTVTTTVTTFIKVAQTAASPAVAAAVSVASAASSVASAASSVASAVSVASAASSVASSASSAGATLSTAASNLSSFVPSVFSSSTSRTSDDEQSSRGYFWPFLLLLLLLVPAAYIAFSGIELQPPYVPSFLEDMSLDSLHSTTEKLISPFVLLWSGAVWLTSLLINTLKMIPTFLVEIATIFYGIFQYYSTSSSYGESSVPVYAPPPTSPPGPSVTSEKLESHPYIKQLEILSMENQLKIQQLETLSMENQFKIQQLETLSMEYRGKLLALLKKSEDAERARVETSGTTTVISPPNQDDITSIVRSLLEEYHADRTGKVDYALSSLGATIASIRCTKPFNKRTGEYYLLWGFIYWAHINTPDIILKPGHMPGECWAFEGANGYAVISLSIPIYVTGFSLEHTPKELQPFGHMKTAPKKFSVWGLSSLEDKDEELLGRFEYEDNGKSLQTYDAIELDKPFHMVELRIESNHGSLEYTCLYRFRVHGRPSLPIDPTVISPK
ncbi:hypothetical protein GE061_006102 [Apolygus lucorum]|uniref:Uncharacterized protein n=1 Tax=Apolygus lucorum TaxID=248454 RepID=A0A6A4JCM4_APOLU|nr:hypothetical protein GE061_006102 [Apolygus lucorum]